MILAVVHIIQTIPSMALLVFMIPLLGIGGLPAIAALFLYSLLPIVRNTHAGLHEVPMDIRESAEAIGLPREQGSCSSRLPMASRIILNGVKFGRDQRGNGDSGCAHRRGRLRPANSCRHPHGRPGTDPPGRSTRRAACPSRAGHIRPGGVRRNPKRPEAEAHTVKIRGFERMCLPALSRYLN